MCTHAHTSMKCAMDQCLTTCVCEEQSYLAIILKPETLWLEAGAAGLSP